jgi:transcriptional regulator with XRE-family HTH domain
MTSLRNHDSPVILSSMGRVRRDTAGVRFTPQTRTRLLTLRKKTGMSQAEVAEFIGVHQSVVSDLERGVQRTLEIEALDRLAATFGDDGWRLHADAGVLPAAAEAALAGMFRAVKPDRIQRTVEAVRRREAAEIVRAEYGRIPPGSSGRVEDVTLLTIANLRQGPVTHGGAVSVELIGDTVHLTLPARAADPAWPSTFERRYLLAHAAAHVLLVRHEVVGNFQCQFPRRDDTEGWVTDLACQMLAPEAVLGQAVEYALDEWRHANTFTSGTDEAPPADVWSAEGANIVTAVARRLAIPIWVAVRRLGEDGSLDVEAEVGA